MALPAIAAGAISILGPMLGGLIGGLSSASDREAAQRAAMDAVAEVEKLGLPPDQSAPIILKHFQAAGVLSPQMEHDILIQSSKLGEVKEDPRLRDAQMNALQMLGQRARVGLGPEERAAFNKLRTQLASEEEGKRQQILQGMQARGLGGSGAELAAQLGAAQTGAQIASSQGDDIAAAAARNALDAMSKYGTMSGQVRGQDFDINSTRARAIDEMNRFNVQSQQGTQQRNVASQNAAQQFNLQNAQNIANQNVQVDNNELVRQRLAQSQYYQDLAARAKMLADAKMQRSNILAGQAANTAQNAQNIGSGVGAAAGAIYGQMTKPVAPTTQPSGYVGPYNADFYKIYDELQKKKD